MLEKVPTEEELNELMEEDVFKTWCAINNFIKIYIVMDVDVKKKIENLLIPIAL